MTFKLFNRTFIPYPGGKSLRRDIVEVVDSIPHHCYVEPFGGAASILFSKKPSPVEIYNDIDDDLVTLFQVVSDPALFRQFRRRVRWLPYARTLYWIAQQRSDKKPSDPVSRAVLVYVGFRSTFYGLLQQGCGFAQSIVRNQALAWHNSVRGLVSVHRRLRGVTIENRDAMFVIETYDSPKTLHYVDPPYLLGCKYHYYIRAFDEERHRNLLRLLARLKGMVLLSGYWHELYAPLLSQGWKARFKEQIVSMAIERGTERRRALEMVYANPAALQNMGPFAEDFYGEEVIENAGLVSCTRMSTRVRTAGEENRGAALVNSPSARRVAKRVRRKVSRTAKAKP